MHHLSAEIVLDQDDSAKGPVPAHGKQFQLNEAVSLVTANGDHVQAEINTATGLVKLSEGTSVTPKAWVQLVRTAHNDPNADILFKATKEPLGHARRRSACKHLDGEEGGHLVRVDKDGNTSIRKSVNPVQNGAPYSGPAIVWENAVDRWSEPGPKPTEGDILPAGAAVSALCAKNGKHVVGMLNTWTNRIWGSNGDSCTPDEWVAQIGTSNKSAEKDIIISSTEETLGEAYNREATTLEKDDIVHHISKSDIDMFYGIDELESDSEDEKYVAPKKAFKAKNSNQGTCEICGKTGLGALGTHRRFCTGLKVKDPATIVKGVVKELVSQTMHNPDLAMDGTVPLSFEFQKLQPSEGPPLPRFALIYAKDKAFGNKHFGTMNTLGTKVIYNGKELAPTSFVRVVQSDRRWPNTDIIFNATGESLGDARRRGACQSSYASAGGERKTRPRPQPATSRPKRTPRPKSVRKKKHVDSEDDDIDEPKVSIDRASLRRRKEKVTYNEGKIAQEQMDKPSDSEGDSGNEEEAVDGADSAGRLAEELKQITDIASLPSASSMGILVDQLARNFQKNGVTLYIPLKSLPNSPPCLFPLEKYKEARAEADEACRKDHGLVGIKEVRKPVKVPGRGRGRPRKNPAEYEARERMKQEARAAKQQQAYERGLKRAEKLSKGALASEQKRSLKYASVEQKRYLKAQIQKRKLESAEKLRQEILLSAEHMKQCESVLEYVVSEVEERYWEEHVPQSNPDALYAGSLRFLANVLNQSRIVNRPKTQAMYAYASLARQWHDNYLDRIRSAPELMSKVAASQVLYFDGLRFSEYEFVAQVLPSLKAQLLTSLKELDEAIGSGAAWAQYQKDICASGISRLATNKDLEDLQENYSALIYKKPMERFTKRIKQNYKARGGQPAFIPKHRTQEGRNSLKKVWAMRNSGSSNGTSSLEKKLALADKAVKKQKQEAKLEARRARQNAAHAVRREVKIIERAEAAKVSKKPAFPVVNVEGVGTRRVVTYVGGERVLPRGMDGNSDPRKGRQWGLGLPYVSVTLNRDRTDPAMKPYVTNRDAKPKRRRVVCVLNGKRVSFPSDN